MRLSEEQWILAGGATPEWRGVMALRLSRALADLRRARAALRRGPRSLAPLELAAAMDRFLRARGPERDRIALHPGFDCWLSLTRSFLQRERPAADWEAHFPFFQSFAAALALETKGAARLRARLCREGRFHLTGSDLYFEFGREAAGAEVSVELSGGRARAVAPGRRGGTPRRLARVTPGMFVEFRDPLVMQPVSVQVPARPGEAEGERFRAVLAGALERIGRLDPQLREELDDFLRILVPLENPKNMGSVSSSYRELRGALCLSHTEDQLLQEETLIHEFAHQKLNLVSEADELLKPGQGGQIFFSPLRPDARRLRGLYLGAHAFIAVNRYLMRLESEERLAEPERDALIRNVCRRLFHIEDMLRAVSGYALLTDLGARGCLLMWRELMLQHHAARRWPPSALSEGRRAWGKLRKTGALGETGLHRGRA